MKFAGWQRESFIDYPGKNSTLLFTSGCNYNCGYCHNPELKKLKEENISEQEVIDYLQQKKWWIDAVVISGGEPTLQKELKGFLRKIKDLDFLVKLDTNGENFKILLGLKNKKLVDYVAMDVKGPLNLYSQIIGREFIDEKDSIGKGISVVSQFPDYEFRTTVIPIFENGIPRWISPKEIGETVKLIKKWGNSNSKYFLQPFKAIEKKEIKGLFTRQNLPEEMKETPRKHLEKCLIEAKKYLPKADIR